MPSLLVLLALVGASMAFLLPSSRLSTLTPSTATRRVAPLQAVPPPAVDYSAAATVAVQEQQHQMQGLEAKIMAVTDTQVRTTTPDVPLLAAAVEEKPFDAVVKTSSGALKGFEGVALLGALPLAFFSARTLEKKQKELEAVAAQELEDNTARIDREAEQARFKVVEDAQKAAKKELLDAKIQRARDEEDRLRKNQEEEIEREKAKQDAIAAKKIAEQKELQVKREGEQAAAATLQKEQRAAEELAKLSTTPEQKAAAMAANEKAKIDAAAAAGLQLDADGKMVPTGG